jgi:hypothetical protein
LTFCQQKKSMPQNDCFASQKKSMPQTGRLPPHKKIGENKPAVEAVENASFRH